MLILTYSAAAAAAALNASSSVMQRLATNKPSADRLFSSKFAYEMVKSRLFILGLLFQIAGFVGQAVALNNGPLIIVEPILSCDLVFLLLIIHWKIGIKIQLRDWLAISAIILGLSGLFISGSPKSGHLDYQAMPWIILVSVLGSLIVILALAIRRLKSETQRAILAGIAASGAFALNAAFTKLGLNIYAHQGIVSLLTSWPLYALIISGITSIYLMVNAYGAGPLAISQPVMEVFEPAMAVTIGIIIFGDSYSTSAVSLAVGALCVIVLAAGIISLGSSPKIHQAGQQGI